MAYIAKIMELLEPFIKTPLFDDPLSQELNENRLRYLAALDGLSALILKRQEEIRALIQASSEDTEWQDKSNVGSITAGTRTKKSPDSKAVQSFLEELEIPSDLYLDQTTSYTINPSKVNELINRGKIPEDTLTRFIESKPVFTIRLSKRIKSDMYSALGLSDSDQE